MLNRSEQPFIGAIEKLELPPVQTLSLDNGIPVYVVNMGTQEVLKLEIIFFAGRPFEHKKLVARATAAMLKEGSKNYDSATIAEQFDFYGSSFRTPFNIDTAVVEVYSLNKYFDNVLPIAADILAEPSFPQKELDTYIQVNQQSLQIDLTKNDTVAYRTVTELIFGADNPYGYNSFPATYGELRRDDLVQHYQRCFNSSNCAIVISGKVDDKVIASLNRHIGQAIRTGDRQPSAFQRQPSPERKVRINHPDTVQMAIRLGRDMFNRKHPDYPGMYVLNTVLGGYFGSRLMENIREDKGYTYNIYTVLDTMTYDGCFYVGTEVGNEFARQTLEEIYREMEILRREPIGEEEFVMVHNYIMGGFLNMLDGPFNVSEIVKTIVSEELPMSYFNDLVKTIQAITPDDLLVLAQRYLNPNDYWEVIVGATTQLP